MIGQSIRQLFPTDRLHEEDDFLVQLKIIGQILLVIGLILTYSHAAGLYR
jgi:hypothetical protein